ncbi:Bifunctional inhibitor/lipid-transfer protein/seed storage 2S albumin superfamily protein [Euphorbia peplus]|nr:Bifunctional inhibitor/lipid-transfer protein/seed storage 2S albumin superfamily protein [Euphorbia peplus]
MEVDKKVAVLWLVAMCLVMTCMSTLQQDEEECAEQLTNLASCIPFVSGSAKKPTPECCQDTLKVKTNKPKCLCVLIKESADPSMGLPVNTTLALQMPSVCNIDADVSNCPSILKLAADSPDAKIFKTATTSDSTSTTTSSSSSSSSSGSPSSTSSSDSSDSKSAASDSNNAPKRMVFEGPILLIMIMTFVASSSIFFI